MGVIQLKELNASGWTAWKTEKPSKPGRYAVIGESRIAAGTPSPLYVSTDFVLCGEYFGPETDLDDEIPEIKYWISLDTLKVMGEYEFFKMCEDLRRNRQNLYEYNKTRKIGEHIYCPTCGSEFDKVQWSQAFCSGKCKDDYWNKIRSNHGGKKYLVKGSKKK